MTYADYDYYSGTYLGTVSEGDFPRLAVRASSFLDYYTQNRAKDNADLDAVKMCCCALVDKKKLLAETCMEYLAHTGLLYRGGGCRCTLPTL